MYAVLKVVKENLPNVRIEEKRETKRILRLIVFKAFKYFTRRVLWVSDRSFNLSDSTKRRKDMKDKFRIVSIPCLAAKEWLLKKHYAGRAPTVNIYGFALVEKEKNRTIGVATFGYCPNRNLGASVCGKDYKDTVLEFNRLCIDYSERKNLATFFAANAIKLLPKPLILVSYADQNQGHVGYVYQALNWIYTGEGSFNEGKYLTTEGKIIHRRSCTGKIRGERYEGKIEERIPQKPKHRYIYFHGDKRWAKEARKHLRFPILHYPKGESKRYEDLTKVKQINLGFGIIPVRPLKERKLKRKEKE